MFRLWEIGRIRKRTLIVALATLAAVVGTGSVVLLFAAESLQARTPYFRILDKSAGANIIGAGLDIDFVPTANMVSDPSFEPLVFRQQLTVLSGDAQRILVSAEEAKSSRYGEGFFNGAMIRIVSPSEQGMTLRKSAAIASYGVNRIGGFQPVNRPADLPEGIVFLDFAQKKDLIIAAGERGTVLVGLNTQTPVMVKTGIAGDLTGICAAPVTGFLACSRDGDILYSSDAVSWKPWTVPSGLSLDAVAASDNGFVAVGQDGAVLVGAVGIMTRAETVSDAHLRDVVYGNGRFLACGDNGAVLVSPNGIVWETLNIDALANWTCADFRDGLFILAGSGGQICIIDSNGHLKTSILPDASSIVDVVFLTQHQLIVLDAWGQYFVSDDSGASWTATDLEPGMRANRIAATTQDRIVSASADGALGTSLLVNEIVLDNPLAEGGYQAGDLAFFEFVTQRLPDTYKNADAAEPNGNLWELSRTDAAVRIDGQAAPGSGTGSMRLSVTPEADNAGEAAFLSQILVPEDGATRFERGKLYTVELWLRQEDLDSRKVLVWLTGRFQSMGTVIEDVGNTWKKYAYTSLLPANAANARPGEIRLNIGIEGGGTAWVDGIWLGRTEEQPGRPDTAFMDRINRISPAVLRMSFLGIGESGTRSQAWMMGYGNEASTLLSGVRVNGTCGSLETALTLAKDAGAVPWLTIGPYASEEEIRNLVEYLAGPMTEPYGKIRMENGTARPWSDVFPRIYLEFLDPDNVLSTDSRRASFVNHLVEVVRQSPYYPGLRNKTAFVDGMVYEDALMLSSADYHASSIGVSFSGADIVQTVRSAYRVYFDASPRIMDRPSDTNYELVRTADIRFADTASPTLAAMVETTAFGLQEGYSTLLIRPDPDAGIQNSLKREETAGMLSALHMRGIPLEVVPLADTPGSIAAFAFRNGKTVSILLVNLANQAFSFPLDSQVPLAGAAVRIYDDAGQLVSSEQLRRAGSTVDVLAGGVTVLVAQDPAGTN